MSSTVFEREMSLYFFFQFKLEVLLPGKTESFLSSLVKNRSSNLSQSMAIKILTLALFLLFWGEKTNITHDNRGLLAKSLDVLPLVLASTCLGALILMIVVGTEMINTISEAL